MIGRFLFLCVAGVGVLGIVAALIELKRRIVARRGVNALARARAAQLAESRRALVSPSSITSVIRKLEESGAFAAPAIAKQAQPARRPAVGTTPPPIARPAIMVMPRATSLPPAPPSVAVGTPTRTPIVRPPPVPFRRR